MRRLGLSMRLSRSRLTRACVYPGVGWPKHASIPGSVGASIPELGSIRLRDPDACVYPGVGGPSIVYPGIDGMRHPGAG